MLNADAADGVLLLTESPRTHSRADPLAVVSAGSAKRS